MTFKKRLRKSLRFLTSAVLLGMSCLAAIYWLNNVSNKMVRPPLESMENQVIDLAFQIRKKNASHTKITTDDIVIIDIDDASINELGRTQLWPRSYDARVINYIASGNPKAIGIDFLYTESDQLSSAYIDILAAKGFTNASDVTNAMSTDHELTEAISNAGNVYLSLFDDGEYEAQIFDTSLTNTLRLIRNDSSRDITFSAIHKAVLPIDDFLKNAKGAGTIAMPTMQDGTVRHYRVLQQMPDSLHGKQYIANFPFYMLLDAYGIQDKDVAIENNRIVLNDSLQIPLRNDGSFRINWLGQEDKIRSISYYKIWDELVPAEYFEGKYVFFGTSASGLQDLKTVPSTAEKMPGVEVHAIAFLNMMNSAYLKEISNEDALPWFAILSVLLVSMFLITKPLIGFVVALVLYVAERFLFELWVIPEYGIIFPITMLMLLTMVCYLAASLFTYFIRERKSRRLKSAFGTYVSPEIVEQIAKDPGSLYLGGEKKELTVLFTDIRNFTSYSEKLDPQKIVAVLNNYLSAMSDIIFKHKGTIDKFIGDAIMAIFGAPISQKDHADRACRVALDMIENLKEFNEEELREGRPPINIGIGINTGDMTVGNIGSSKRFDYTVIGDAVNLGSRLEGLTKFFGVDIIVSAETKRACTTDEFLFRELGSVVVKGKDIAISAFELVQSKNSAIKAGEHLHIWENAIDAMRQKNLVKATELLNDYLKYHPEDIAATYFIDKCSEYSNQSENFSLVLKMDTK
jgi:adenylate cyclase